MKSEMDLKRIALVSTLLSIASLGYSIIWNLSNSPVAGGYAFWFLIFAATTFIYLLVEDHRANIVFSGE